MSKKSKTVYPKEALNEFENFMAKTPISEDYWQDIKKEELITNKNKNHNNVNDYMMEMGEEITFENLNEDNLRSEGQVDIDSIIRNMDMSDHSYRDNIW